MSMKTFDMKINLWEKLGKELKEKTNEN